ncbi:MAG: PfkB family carbohydrate kinase, partial [Deltaproteobacteria bacterium]|nr:PfkB family carbohydrate kinase [Deltaproteobacteria bacterium]
VLLKKGLFLVVLSLGGDGAIFVGPTGVYRALALKITVRSSVGAGDSMIGALLYGFASGLPEEECYKLAMAASAGACTTEGTNPPGRALVDDLLKQTQLQKIS